MGAYNLLGLSKYIIKFCVSEIIKHKASDFCD